MICDRDVINLLLVSIIICNDHCFTLVSRCNNGIACL
jgi:hypothetical protein